MSGDLPGGLLGIQKSWECRGTLFHAQQARCIGMCQPASTCAEAIQSNLVGDGLKHTSGSKGLVRVVQAVQDWESPRDPGHRHWKKV